MTDDARDTPLPPSPPDPSRSPDPPNPFGGGTGPGPISHDAHMLTAPEALAGEVSRLTERVDDLEAEVRDLGDRDEP